MAFLKLLANIGLAVIIATALPVNDTKNNSLTVLNYRLPDNVVPIHYNLKIIPYIKVYNFTFDGDVSINIEILRASRNLSLHVHELTIDEVTTSIINSDGVAYTPVAHDYNNQTDILVLHFDDELPPGLYTLHIKFVGILNDDLEGFYRTSYWNEEGNRVWLATTHFEATSARRAFPCWDEPALKATFNISIKHYRNYTAISNMPMREQSDDGNGDGMLWTHFDTTPVMSTYLVAFVVSDFVRIPNTDSTVNMWCRRQLAPYIKFGHTIAEKSGQLMTLYTNSTDKVPKMDHVAVPEFSAGAMENWGLIIYQEASIKYNKEKDHVFQKHRVAVTAAHEMAHQWFGNIVSPLWWSYVWLNEGFASFFENYILNQLFGHSKIMDIFVVKNQHDAFHMDVAKNVMPITAEVNSPEEIESLFNVSSYSKAPVILRMLQHIITDEVFRNGIIKYLHRHQFSSATSDDLWNTMQAALDESNVPHNDYKLKEVMDTWITQRHYPVVHVTRNYDTGEVTLKQEHLRSYVEDNEKDDIDDDKWWIPITYTTQTNPNFSHTVPTHWLKPQNQTIIINGVNPNDWIIVNLQQMGYYLVNYDDINWRKIARYLNSDEYTKIHVLNRAQIVNDAYHLLMANQLNITTFLHLVSFLERDTHYLSWSPMFTIFTTFLHNILQMPGGEIIKKPLNELVSGIVNSVGYEENPNDDSFIIIKRIKALDMACKSGHTICRRMASEKLNEYLANPETHNVSPNLEEWTYCNGLMEANASTWNHLFDIYVNDSSKLMLLEYLTCSEDPEILINYFNIATKNDSIVHDIFYDTFYNLLVSKHANNDLVLDHLLANLENSVSRGIELKMALNLIIHNVHSEKRIGKIIDFAQNNFKEDEEILKYTLDRANKRLLTLLKIYLKFKRTVTSVTDK